MNIQMNTGAENAVAYIVFGILVLAVIIASVKMGRWPWEKDR